MLPNQTDALEIAKKRLDHAKERFIGFESKLESHALRQVIGRCRRLQQARKRSRTQRIKQMRVAGYTVINHAFVAPLAKKQCRISVDYPFRFQHAGQARLLHAFGLAGDPGNYDIVDFR